MLQHIVEGHILHPTGLEILINNDVTDAQLWNVEHAWYNGKFYKSPEELAQEHEDGCVNVVVPGNPLPMSTEQPPDFYRHHVSFSEVDPTLVHPGGTLYTL